MDRLIARRMAALGRPAVHEDGRPRAAILQHCDHFGVAFQSDMTRSVAYDEAYFEKYRAYRLAGRYGQVERRRAILTGTTGCEILIDIGVGCGTFLEFISEMNFGAARQRRAYGYDINPTAAAWLRSTGRWRDPYHDELPAGPIAWTLWDVLEHIPQPHELLDRIRVGDSLLVSLPIYDDLADVPGSHHFRPDEHYYYFTRWGFTKWITEHGFQVIAYNEDETKPDCGREGIGTFVCRRVKEPTP